MLKQKWQQISLNFRHTLLFLIAYPIAHIVFLGVFYSGYTGNFDAIFPSLHHDPYLSGSPFFSAFLHPLFSFFCLLFAFPLWQQRKKIAWDKLTEFKWIRLLVFVAALLLAWELSTYDYNYYTDSAQYLERTLLILLAFLILRNPAFVLPFIILSLFYRSEFNYPIGGFTLFDKRLLFDILILFYCFLVLGTYVKNFSARFMLIVLCLIASNYFMSGIGKFMVSPHGYEWLAKDKMQYLFSNVHQSGWISGIDQSTYESMYGFLERFNLPIKFFVLLLELSGLFLLWRRKTGMWLFVLFFIMHIGIFTFGSMLFWKWMIIDLVAFCFLLKMKKEEESTFFSAPNFRLSIFIIVFSFIWFRPFPIAWNDTPANQFFTYEVDDASGKTYQLERNTMNPYHQLFQYDTFFYLMDRNSIKISPFGYTFRGREASSIIAAGPKRFLDLEQSLGKNFYDKNKEADYEHFIRTYFKNRNAREGKFFPHLLTAPHHIYNSEPGTVYTGKEKVKKFRAYFNQTYCSGLSVDTLRQQLIKEIDIP